MPVFAVMLFAPHAAVTQRVNDIYPDAYRITDELFLVTRTTTAVDMAKSVGLWDKEMHLAGAQGAVFRLDDWAGNGPSQISDWLREAEKIP